MFSGINDGTKAVAPAIEITTMGGDPVDWSGLDSMKLRLQLGCADECEIQIEAQTEGGSWRPDMPMWQIGGTLKISAGYDGDLSHIQTFEIVSTTNTYSAQGTPSMTIRAVSELARAARNRNPRTFANKDDFSVLSSICSEYGWKNNASSEAMLDLTLDLKSKFTKKGRIKAQGTTDLELLKIIAAEAGLGGPRIDQSGALIMPEPTAENPLVFIRGASTSGDVLDALLADSQALISFSPSREGGSDNVQLAITAWDPEQKKFIEKVFEADEFGGDPKVIYTGPLAASEIPGESSTRGLVLQVIVSRGWNKDDRRDVLAMGRYINETDAASLAKRWFDLREKLGRWATIEVEGHPGLLPYHAVIVDGDMAKMDKGYWLPTVVEHSFSDGGWDTRLTCIRVVDDSTIVERGELSPDVP